MTSPRWTPASDAGAPSSTRTTTTPSVELEQGVAGLETRLGGRAVRDHLVDEHALRVLGAERAGQLGAERLDRDAEPAARHAALVAKLGVDLAGHVRGDREADAGAPGDDRGVDPDHLTLHVHERTAGVAGIDGGVGLQEVVERTLVELPRLGADDAGGDRGLETERRAPRG